MAATEGQQLAGFVSSLIAAAVASAVEQGTLRAGLYNTDPDVIRGIERVTGERYSSGRWTASHPGECAGPGWPAGRFQLGQDDDGAG